MLDFDTLYKNITQWGVDRNIIGAGKSKDQFPKLLEEYGEAAEGENDAAVKDGIGDTFVVATMIAGIEGITITRSQDVVRFTPNLDTKFLIEFGKLGSGIARSDKPKIEESLQLLIHYLECCAVNYGVNFLECLDEAYNEIKDRKGILYDGCFIKEADPRYPAIVKLVNDQKTQV